MAQKNIIKQDDKLTSKQVDKKSDQDLFVLGKQNYVLLLIGFVIIVIGFILMSGGGTNDPSVFSDNIFSFRRITLAPIVVLIGFAVEVFAIMKKPKKQNDDNQLVSKD